MTRHTVDTITSDALDALYERLAVAEHEADASVTAATQLATLVGKRSEKAEKTAKAQQRRAEIAEAELRTLRAGLRANGADPTQIQNLWAQIHLRNRQWRDEKQRAERAEAAIARVRKVATAIRDATAAGRNDWQIGQHDCALTILAALTEPAPAATEATGHRYLSTGCLHGEHGYCQAMTGQAGRKKPARCKWCAAPCQCPCHRGSATVLEEQRPT